jgi:hypothetical protein
MVIDSSVGAGGETGLSITADRWFAEAKLSDPSRFVRLLPAGLGAGCESPCGAPVGFSRATSGFAVGAAEGADAVCSSSADATVGC